MKTIQLFSLGLVFLMASCGGESSSSEVTTTDSTSTEEPTTNVEQPKEKAAPQSKTVYAWVDRLRIRDKPTLEGKEIVKVAEGTALTFTGEISPNKIKVTLRGREMEAPFYKVVTPSGEKGWTFAGALSVKPVDVENYRIAIAFDQRDLDPEEDSGDFGYYLYEAGQMLVGTGIELIYVDEKFEAVEIKNGKGEIIGVENISHHVKKHTTGIICIEKGGITKFVDYDPSMGEYVKEAFGISDHQYEGCSG